MIIPSEWEQRTKFVSLNLKCHKPQYIRKTMQCSREAVGRGIAGSRDESCHCTAVPRRLPQICFANPFSWKRRLKTSFSWVSTPPPLKRYGPRKLSRNLNNFVETFPLSSVWSSEDLECINLPVSGRRLHFCWGHLCRCLFRSSLEALAVIKC